MDRLSDVFQASNALLRELGCGIVGRHQITRWEVVLPDGILILEHDTYLGISITGPDYLVNIYAAKGLGFDYDTML
jgi:hypothetical protein